MWFATLLLLCLRAFSAGALFGGGGPRLPLRQQPAAVKLDANTAAAEARLLSILEQSEAISGGNTGLTLDDQAAVENAIQVLEASKSGIKDPVTSPLIDGVWRLLYTTTPATNSPIQKKVTSLKGVAVYQVVNLLSTGGSFLPGSLPDISNTVCVGDAARLRVTAIASTTQRPLVEPRQGDGTFFGLAPFGKSSSAAPRSPLERIDFAFQEARLEIKGQKLTVPYPVPFKLLGDEAKGWIDNTYVSNTLRVARGNKGTTFVLRRADAATDPLAKLASEPIDSLQSGGASVAAAAAATTAASTATAAKDGKKRVSTTAATKAVARPSALTKTAAARNKTPAGAKKVVVVFPAQLGAADDYAELCQGLRDAVGVPAYVAPLAWLDWPVGLIPSFFSQDYLQGTLKPKTLAFYFDKVDVAVRQALEENPSAEIVLLAHSIGGWIARAWLSEWAAPDVKKRVKKLVTLGSPHNPPPAGTTASKIDQTRGLLTYVNENFPGSYEKGVQYVSVIGSAVTGRTAVAANALAESVESLVAYSSYSVLSGDTKEQPGDGTYVCVSAIRRCHTRTHNIFSSLSLPFRCRQRGLPGIIPVSVAALQGATLVVLPDTKHSNYLPTPGKSIKVPLRWYGDALGEWQQYL